MSNGRNKNKRVAVKKRRRHAKAESGESSGSGAASSGRKRFAVSRKRVAGSGGRTGGGSSSSGTMSRTLAKQAQERMVLKEHLAELHKRKLSRVRGEDAKTERRQMARYMRELRREQIRKHSGEITDVALQQRQDALLAGGAAAASAVHRAAGIDGRSRKKALRYGVPVTVGLPHGRSAAIPAMATPQPGNVGGSVRTMVGALAASGALSQQERKQRVRQSQPGQQQQQRWRSGAGDDEQDEWLDDDDGVKPKQQQQQRQPNASDLKQLFAGFGGM
jgi:hypothetical protein